MRLFELFNPGETQICGVVHYLLLRSPELRDALIQAINEKTPHIDLVSSLHFSCSRERTTTKADGRRDRGRVDMLLEVDNAVIGIEAKIGSSLSDDQPHRYIDGVRTHATLLSGVRGSPVSPVIVLLLPNWQIAHADEMIAANRQHFSGVTVCTLDWDGLCDAWRRAPVTDNVARFVLDEMESYVSIQTGRNIEFVKLLPQISAPLHESQHEAHYQFVYWLFSAFRGNRISLKTRVNVPQKRADRTYLGYQFLAPETDGVWGWYGFVRPDYADIPNVTAPALVMGTNFDIAGLTNDNSAFQRVKFTHPAFGQDFNWWRIHFNRGWDNLNRWREAPGPMQQAANAASETMNTLRH